jgi:sirohydrochlorin cobaltochelatase
MPAEIQRFLGGFLRKGPCLIGQVHVSPELALCNADDVERDSLTTFGDPHDALIIARYDDQGEYRPLKTAPNLRHGWALRLKSLEEATLALDFLYPAALGTAHALAQGALKSVNLRETLARQTGMYAVTRKISDEQAESIIARTCNHADGCIRHILWSISAGRPSSLSGQRSDIQCAMNEIPIFCAEACNLLVAAARKVVKSSAVA